MKSKLHSLFIMLAMLAGINQAAAQGARFFRISGPATTAISAFRPDGTMVWSNAQPATNYTIQTISSLSDGSNWVDYVQLLATNDINTNLLIDLALSLNGRPSGKELCRAGTCCLDRRLQNSIPVTSTSYPNG